MKPATFEEVCRMDYLPPQSPKPATRRSGDFTQSVGYESLQSLKTTMLQTQPGHRQSREKRASLMRRSLPHSQSGSLSNEGGNMELSASLRVGNPLLRQRALVLRTAALESENKRSDAFEVLNSVLDDSVSALQSMEAKYRKTLEQKKIGQISKQSLDVERSQTSEVTRLSREVQSLRAESRHLAILEGELKLARIVYGHTQGLEVEDAEAVEDLHSSYKRTPGLLAVHEQRQKDSHHPEVKHMINQVSLLQKRNPKEELMVPDLPWLRTVAPFMRKEGDESIADPEILRTAPAKMDLDYVYTYMGQYGRRNIKSLSTGELLYSAGAVCVVLDVDSRKQRLFRGHTDLILSITLFPFESGGLVASGQIGDEPMVCLWSTQTMQELVRLKGNSIAADPKPLMLARSVVSLSFSPDGRTLVAVGDDDEHTIAVHRNEAKGDLVYTWESSQVVDVQKGAEQQILCAEFSPFSPLFVTCGVRHMKFWELNQKNQLHGTDGLMGCESQEETFLCLAFLDADTMISGLESGMIWIWKGQRVMKTIWNAHHGPVFDIAIDGFTAISGGEDMKLCMWNFAKEFRLVPPGEFTRGEMLVKEIEVERAVCQTPGVAPWIGDLGVGSIRSLSWKGHRVAVGTSFNHLFVIDDNAATGALLFPGHYRGGLKDLAMHPRLPWMFTAGGEGTVLVWNLVSKKVELARNYEKHRAFRKKTDLEREREAEQEEEGLVDLDWHKKRKVDWRVGMTCIDVSNNGQLIAVGQDDGGFFIQKLEYHEGRSLVLSDLFAVMPASPQRAVSKIRFSPDLMEIAVAYETGVIKLYALSELVVGEPKHLVCRGLHSSVRHMDWDEAGVVIRCNDDHFQLTYVDARDAVLIKGRGPLQAVRGGDRELKNSKWASVTCPLSWQTHGLYLGEHNSGDVTAVARSPHKRLLAAGDVYGNVILGRNPCLSEQAGLEQKGGHGEEVHCLGFSRKSDMLVSGGSKAATIFQWQVKHAEPLASTREDATRSKAEPSTAVAATPPPRLEVVGIGTRPPAWSRDFGWADTAHDLTRLVLRGSHVPLSLPRSTAEPFLEPWRMASLPPKGVEVRNDPGSAEGCDFEAELESVMGYSGAEHRGNIICLLSGETVYPSGAICVLASADGDQRYFRGHTETVTALAVHPNGGVVASGDAGDEASIMVWDSGGGRWTGRSLWVADAYITRSQKKGVVSLSFSGDGVHLLSLGGDDAHTLMVHKWEEDTPLLVAQLSGGDQPVLAACFNPYSTDVISCGVGHVRFWSFTSKGLHSLHSGVGEAFLEWAVTQEACCSTQQEAIDLGEVLLRRTCVSAAFLDESTAVTGSVDGRIYLWKKQHLQSAEKGHDGAVFDVDSSQGRGLFRGTLVITMEGARKEVLSLLSQGARSEEDRQQMADAAMQRWFDNWKSDVGRAPMVKNAVVSWSAMENAGIASCGGQEVKIWGWELELCIGFRGFTLSESFDRYSTAGRGRHKWRPRSMTLDEFHSFLQGVGLLFNPHQLHDKASTHIRAVEQREGLTHPMVNAVEATRVFASAELQEIGMEEFVEMVGQVVGLVAAKERGDTPHCHRREKLEMDMVDLQGHLSDLERYAMQETEDYSHRILQVREEIKRVALQLKAMKVYVRRVLRVVETFNVGNADQGGGVGVNVALFHRHDRKLVVGTSSDNVVEIHMETGQCTAVANGHGGGAIGATCALNQCLIALAEVDGPMVHVWDVLTGREVMQGRFRAPALSMDVVHSKTVTALAVGLKDGTVHLVEVADGLPALCALRIGGESAGGVTSVRFAPDGSALAAGMADSTVQVLRVEGDKSGGSEFGVLKQSVRCHGHGGKITAMDWSTDGNLLRSESRDGKDLLFWSAADGRRMAAHAAVRAEWHTGSCMYGWQCRSLHRHVAASNPVVNKTIAPVVGHRVRECMEDGAHRRTGRGSGERSGMLSKCGRVMEVAEGGWFTVGWEGGEVAVAEQACELVYGGEELESVDSSEGLLVGSGSSGSLMLVLPQKTRTSVFHCAAHAGAVRGVAFLRDSGGLVSAGAEDRTLLRWSCKRRHRRAQGLYVDLERVLAAGAMGSMGALLTALEDFATRYFGLDGSVTVSAETKARHFRLVRLFRVICGAGAPFRKLLRIQAEEPSPPPPSFVGRSPIRRTFHKFVKAKPAWAKASTPRAREPMRSKQAVGADGSARDMHAAPAHSQRLDREARFVRFRDVVFAPVGHGQRAGKPKVMHLRLGPLHVEGGVLKPSEANAIFAALDRGSAGVLSHSDFINGLRKFPRFASRLGLPTILRQGDGSMDVYLRTFSEIDTNSSKTIELDEFITYFCRSKEEEIVKAEPLRIENRPWSYTHDVITVPRAASKAMMITGSEPRRRRVRERQQGVAVAPGPVSLSDADMQELLQLLGFARSGPVTYQAFVSGVLASPKATTLLREKGVRPEQCAALYCFRFKGGEEWVKWRPEQLQVALYRPSWEVSWIHRRMLSARDAWLIFKRLDPSHVGLKFQRLPVGQRATVTFETLFAALLAFPDIAETLSMDAVLLLDRKEAELRVFRLLFGERETLVDDGREIHLAEFVSLFSEQDLPPSEGTLLLPSAENLELSRRFNLSQREARNTFRQLAACKSASQDRSVLRHADFLNGLRTFPKIATLLGLPERIGPSGGGLARYQMLVAEIFGNKRTISEDDFARYFHPHGREQAWRQQVVVRMITDGEEDEHKTPPPSPKKPEHANAHVGTADFESDADVFPEKANEEIKASARRSLEQLSMVRSSAQHAVTVAHEVLDVVRSPLVDMGPDMERRIAMTLSRIGVLCICPAPLRLSDVELAGRIAAAGIRET